MRFWACAPPGLNNPSTSTPRKQPSLALAEFERSLAGDPNRFRNLYGAGRAAELAGEHEKAEAFYSRLLAQVGPQAAGRGEIERARKFVGKR